MGFLAARRLRWGHGYIEPGEAVPENEEGRSYASLLRLGHIVETTGSAEMSDDQLRAAYDKVEGERDAALKRLAELEAAASKRLEVDATTVEIPEGVTPGETPGWPIDAVTGGALALTDEQRSGLEADGISGEAIVTHQGDIVQIETEEAEEVPGQDDIDLGTVEGSGKNGRIVEPDVQKIIDARS